MSEDYKLIALEPGEGERVAAMGIELVFKSVGADFGGFYYPMKYNASEISEC